MYIYIIYIYIYINEETRSETSGKTYMKTKYEIFLQWNTKLCVYVYIFICDCLSIRDQKQELLAIFAFTFTHRYTGTNKPRWQNLAFDLVI